MTGRSLDGPQLTVPVGERDHVEGDPSSPLTLLEYGDFECPQCGQAYPLVRELRRRFGARLRFAFRHFPLTNVHPHAQRAAETAEWAGSQQAFWRMHDALYEDQAHLGDAALLARARVLGLGQASLERAWAAYTYVPRIKEDFLGGIRSGVDGTPTFFINGVRHDGPWDLESLAAALSLQEPR